MIDPYAAYGSQVATPQDRRRVSRALLAHIGQEKAVSAAELAREAGVAGRTTRRAYADLDGCDFVLGHAPAGVFIARDRAEADALTRELKAKAMALLQRARRRDAYFDGLAQLPLLEAI